MKALIIIDVQNDFVPGGRLPVQEGTAILPVINQLLKQKWDAVIASKDWHPQAHISFASTHHKKVGEVVMVDGIEQILWPDHCVQGTTGADFVPGWDISRLDLTVYKGADKQVDSYSAFFDNQRKHSTGLHEFLQKRNIDEVYLVGLATDYCVLSSVLDALHLNYKTYVIQAACRGVNRESGDSAAAFEKMKAAGAILL